MSGMREDFEAAIEASGLESEDENALEETQQEIEATGTDVEGEHASDDEKMSDAPQATVTDADSDTTIPDKKAAKEAKADDENDSLKAPVDWSPKQRESWSKIPRPIQDKIVAREQEMAQSMAGTAEARKASEHFNQLARSYAPVIAAEGVHSPMEAVEGLFKTAANLRMGSPEAKARQIAQMIQHYGVDIQALDSVLVGQAPEVNQNSQLEQMIDQRMAPINEVFQQLGTMQQNKQQQTQQAANASVVEFGANAEFLNDVRMDMADLIDMAAKQGRNLTLQEAYDRACTLNPDISAVLDDRKKHEQITGGRNSLQAKRNAASTLNGKMTGTGGGGGALSMRDTISAAWDDAGG